MPITVKEIEKLSIEQRLALIELIWSTLDRSSQLAEVPQEHLQVVRAELAEHRRDPAAGVEWEEFRKTLGGRPA